VFHKVSKQCRNYSAVQKRFLHYVVCECLQCIDTVGWAVGRASGLKKTSGWVLICLEQDAHLHMAQLMPWPLIVSCFSNIQIGFTFLVLAHPGCPGQRAIKRVCCREWPLVSLVSIIVYGVTMKHVVKITGNM